MEVISQKSSANAVQRCQTRKKIQLSSFDNTPYKNEISKSYLEE